VASMTAEPSAQNLAGPRTRHARGTFGRIAAVAGLTIQAVLRSRLFMSLVVLLMIVVVGLPASVKGDGTLSGQIRVAITYSLGLATVILGIATLWASCASVSQDVHDKQIQLLTTKPLYRADIWLGKWIGMLTVNALLLTITGTVLYGAIIWQTKAGTADPKEWRAVQEDILLPRRLVTPRPLPIADMAQRQFEELFKQGEVAPDANHGDVIKSLQEKILASSLSMSPGETREWLFAIPSRIRNNAAVQLRYRFAGSSRYRNQTDGTWFMGPPDSPPVFAGKISGKQGGPHTLMIPSGIAQPGKTLSVRFEAARGSHAHGVIFDHDHGVEVLIRESTFGFNLARALVIIFCHLALIAALGMTAGAIFSFPVASFIVTALLAMSAFAHYFSLDTVKCECAHHRGHTDAHGSASSLLEQAGHVLSHHVGSLVSPVMTLNPLDELSDGLLVSWGTTGRATGLMLVLYPLVLGALGAFALARRELALPSSTGT